MPAYPGATIDLQVQKDGSIKDMVGGNLATITRLGPKYGMSPTTGKLQPFEGSATNLLLNSYGAASSSGLWTSWNIASNLANSVTRTSDNEGFYGNTAQRIVYNTSESDSGRTFYMQQATPVGSFSAGESVCLSSYIKANLSGCSLRFQIVALSSTNVVLGFTLSPLTAVYSDSFTRISVLYNALPLNTSKCLVFLGVSELDNGDVADITFDAVQLEKVPSGITSPSSYIPTTTNIATRNGKLASERYTNGPGYWASIEESRTNFLLNSAFDVDTNNDGVADYWAVTVAPGGGVVCSLIPSCCYGSFAQRMQHTNQSGGLQTLRIDQFPTATSFAAGESVTASGWFKGSSTGATPTLTILAYQNSTFLGFSEIALPVSIPEWTRYSATYSSLPAGTNRVRVYAPQIANLPDGGSCDISVDALQLEKGAFSTSFIPTATTAVTRPTDYIKLSPGMDTEQGTMSSVSTCYISNSTQKYIVNLGQGILPQVRMFTSAAVYAQSQDNNNSVASVYAQGHTTANLIRNQSCTWQGNNSLRAYFNGVGGPPILIGPISGLRDFVIGSSHTSGNNVLNGYFHRLVAMSNVASEPDIQSMSVALLAGVGITIRRRDRKAGGAF